MTVVEFERQVQKKVFLRTFTYLTHNLDDLMAFADRVLKPFLDAPLPVPPPKQLGVLTRKMAMLKIEEGKVWEASKDTRDSAKEKAAVTLQQIGEAAAVLSALLEAV